MNILKSIGAVFAGIVLIFALSIGADYLLETTEIMIKPLDHNPLWLIISVTIYRNIFNIAGCYLCAVLAPGKSMKHAIILGCIGLVLSTLGCITHWQEGPHWYPISLIITCMPCAYIGGKLKKEK